MEEWKAFVLVVLEMTLEANREATASQALRGVEQYVPGIMDQFAGINQRVQQQGDAINHKMQQQVGSIQALSQLVWSMMSTQLPKKIHMLLDRVLKGALNGGISTLDADREDNDGKEEEDGLGMDPEMEPMTTAAPAVAAVPAPLNTGAVIISRPHSKYTSIIELCNDYNNRFVALEATGAGWRSRVYSVAEQKPFSRVTQVFKGCGEMC
jgi:hypothetical protein